jgi:hypothetical protein
MANEDRERDAASMSTPKLVSETVREALALVRAEIQLAKLELRADLASGVGAAKRLGVAGICALAVVNLLLVAAALALATVMPAWAAALVVAAVVALVGAIAGFIGWKRVSRPLERTRRTLKEDLHWMKERTA